jgi:hypothetical protein
MIKLLMKEHTNLNIRVSESTKELFSQTWHTYKGQNLQKKEEDFILALLENYSRKMNRALL